MSSDELPTDEVRRGFRFGLASLSLPELLPELLLSELEPLPDDPLLEPEEEPLSLSESELLDVLPSSSSLELDMRTGLGCRGEDVSKVATAGQFVGQVELEPPPVKTKSGGTRRRRWRLACLRCWLWRLGRSRRHGAVRCPERAAQARCA